MAIDFGTLVWKQYGAAIDMLEDAIRLCPDPLWKAILWQDTEDVRYGEFWFVAYHALFWLDLYLTGTNTISITVAKSR